MKIFFVISLLLNIGVISAAHGQITRELQNAMNNVPIVDLECPADRDRDEPPLISGPAAYVFAYYKLPYTINLKQVKNEYLGTYVEKVLIDFDSVDLSPEEERRIIKKALIQLQDLIDRQVRIARIAGFIDYTNYSRSYISQFSTNGNAIIAIRELMSSQALFNKLVTRTKSL